jgi:hypothetical protein
MEPPSSTRPLWTQNPVQCGVEVGAQVGVPTSRRGRERTDHEHAGARQRLQPLPDQMAQSTLHVVAGHRVPDRLADHEPHPRTGARSWGEVDDEGRGPGPPAAADRLGEVLARGESVLRAQHGDDEAAVTLRPRAGRGPCGAAPTGSTDPRGSASAGGSRASCDGGDCSAGTYACSRADLRMSRV